jgi:hypothetical protein
MYFAESFGFIINRSSDEDKPVCWDICFGILLLYNVSIAHSENTLFK